MFKAKLFKIGDFDVFFCVNSYKFGGGIALQVIEYPSAEPFGCITVNVPVCPLPSPYAFLDVKNFPGILEVMVDNDFCTGVITSTHSGFVEYPLVRLNIPRINEYSISVEDYSL